MKLVFKCFLFCSVFLAFNSYAQLGAIRGEVTPGTYQSIGANISGSDGVSNVGLNTLKVSNYPAVFNGTSWDRLKGNVNGLNVMPSTGTLTDGSGTITTANASQQVAVANANRRYLYIQNNSDTAMWCNFTTVAIVGQPSIQIAAGASFIMENSAVSTEAVNCIGTLAGKSFTLKQM